MGKHSSKSEEDKNVEDDVKLFDKLDKEKPVPYEYRYKRPEDYSYNLLGK